MVWFFPMFLSFGIKSFDCVSQIQNRDTGDDSGIAVWFNKQNLVAQSTIKAKYCSVANTVAELFWLQSLLNELHIPIQISHAFMHQSNQCPYLIIQFYMQGVRTKHMEQDILFVWEKVLNKSLSHSPSWCRPAYRHSNQDSLTSSVLYLKGQDQSGWQICSLLTSEFS